MSQTRPEGQQPVLSDRLIGSVGFLSFYDRFGLPPMLLVLSASTGLTLANVVHLLAVYTLLYAVGQPLWGLLSDRVGRMTVLRVALVGAVVGAVASTLTDSLLGLSMARGFTGLMVGALYPTMLTSIGDTRHGIERVRSLSSLQSWAALGNTLTTLVSGTLAALVDWRLVFGLTAVGASWLLWRLRSAPSPPPSAAGLRLQDAVTPWALVVYALALTEGMMLFGVLSYVVPALQNLGLSVTLAGILAATYGLGIIVGAVLMRRLAHRVTRTQSIVVGGGILVVAFASAWLWGTATALTLTAFLIGLTNAVLHVSLQGWATEVAPGARATSIALFAGSLFLGSSVATFATADLADQGRYPLIFAMSLAVAVVFTGVTALAHRRFMSGHRA